MTDWSVGIALPPHLNLPIGGYVDIAREAENLGYQRIWATEAGSADAFGLLTACAAAARTIRLATGVLPIQTRGPALTAQASATLQDFSEGRFTLGLGVSTKVVVTDWNGLPWEGTLARLRNYVETVKALLCGETVTRPDGYYPMNGSRLLMYVTDARTPVLLAAVGPAMSALAGEVADGVLLNYVGATAIARVAERFRAAVPDKSAVRSVSAFVRAAVIDDGVAVARAAAAREVMAKVIVPSYRKGFDAQGWQEATAKALALWQGGDRRGAAASLPDEMTDSIVLFGSAADVRDRFAEYGRSGLDEPIVYAVSTEREADAARDQFTATMRALGPAGLT